jgi:hypothetical protein
MSDYYSSMPVRTSRESGDIQNVLVAGWESSTSAIIAIKVDTSGKVYVVGSDFDIRNLDSSQDSVLICGNDGSSTNPPISVDASGNVNVNIVSGAGGYQYQDNVASTGAYGTVALGLDAANSKLQMIAVDSTGRPQVDIAAQTLTAVKISKDVNANTETNPIFVKLTDIAQGGEVHEYDTSAGIGKGLTANHEYILTPAGGKTLMLKQVLFSASGAMKAEVQVGPLLGLVTKAVGFNSSANLMNTIVFDPPIELTEAGAGQRVRVIVTNRDNQAQDLYTTIMGVER